MLKASNNQIQSDLGICLRPEKRPCAIVYLSRDHIGSVRLIDPCPTVDNLRMTVANEGHSIKSELDITVG